MATASGSPPPPIPYEFDVVGTTTAGNFVRARTLPNDTLEVVVAAPANPLVWGANVATASTAAKAGFGVAMYLNGAALDVKTAERFRLITLPI